MSVSFNVVGKVNPTQKSQPKRYYAAINNSGESDVRLLAREIAEVTTVSLPDVIAALESLVMMIPRHIEQGKIVRLGELGSLRLTLRSEGSDTPEAVSASNIKAARYLFAPGQDLKKTLKTLRYSKVGKGSATPAAAEPE